MKIHVKGPARVQGEIEVPGDKSISHRALIAGLLAEGETEITNLLDSEDTRATETFVKMLGGEVFRSGNLTVVRSAGIFNLREPEDVLNAKNSGTTARLFCGVLSGCPFFSVITGDSSLRRRPMKRVTEPLGQMGAKIDGRGEGDRLPVSIRGGNLKGIEYEMKVASAQVKSAIILAGLFAEGETVIIEPLPSRDHTERMFPQFGADVKKTGNRIKIRGGKRIHPISVFVPGDFSSASFFIALGIMIENSDITIRNVGLNPTRTGFLKIVERMGADVSVEHRRTICGEDVGDIRIRGGKSLRGTEVRGEEVPLSIDELPLVALVGCKAEGETVIREAEELRKKESDRISATVSELRKMGAEVEELKDGMVIKGPVELKGAKVHSHGDHRIAMMLYIAGMSAVGETEIEGFECVGISFPSFTRLVKQIEK